MFWDDFWEENEHLGIVQKYSALLDPRNSDSVAYHPMRRTCSMLISSQATWFNN